MISDTTYMEFLESCSSFNKRISGERRHRMPFLDPQTGVAQNSSNLYRSRRDRRNGPANSSVVFVYPAKRFKKRKSTINLLLSDMKCLKGAEDVAPYLTDLAMNAAPGIGNTDSMDSNSKIATSSVSGADLKSQLCAGDVAKSESGEKDASFSRSDQQGWYDDLSDPALEDDFNEPSDGDDYEEAVKSKAKKKPKKGGGKGSRKQIDDIEKIHVCVYCGAKYKTKPGLHYHLTHAHVDNMDQQGAPLSQQQSGVPSHEQFSPQASSRSSSASNVAASALNVTPVKHQPSALPMVMEPPPPLNIAAASASSLSKDKQPLSSNVSQYCDFCLGDASENKKTHSPEELISCKDCGRSGHPTCLQFTANMIISTKRHGWQCIECKSCAMCGTSENDDQLLFCDDCDRGFHMYCLNPPLSAPPEGNWSCHLCTLEFGPNASNPAR